MVSKEMEVAESLDTMVMVLFPYRAPPNSLHATQWYSLKGFILICKSSIRVQIIWVDLQYISCIGLHI